MERKQFFITDLKWMTLREIERMSRSLSELEKYGIKHVFEYDKGRLIISGFTDVLFSRTCDCYVTFLCKFKECRKNEIEEIDEDFLLMFTIDDVMKIKATLISCDGFAETIID